MENAQAQEKQDSSTPVETRLCIGIATFRHVVIGDPDGRKRDQWIDKKNPAPTEVIDNPSAQQWCNRCGHSRRSGPRSDRPATLGFVESDPDEGKRTGKEHSGAHALN